MQVLVLLQAQALLQQGPDASAVALELQSVAVAL
jgi:hypothetical protein